MRFLYAITILCLFLSISPLYAYAAEQSITQAECAVLASQEAEKFGVAKIVPYMYDELEAKAFNHDGWGAEKPENYDELDEAQRQALYTKLHSYTQIMADHAEQCGAYSPHFYRYQALACLMYLTGTGGEVNKEKGLPYCEAAASHGDVKGIVYLMNVYQFGKFGGQKDYKKALEVMDTFIKYYPKEAGLHLWKAAIYRHGGYGVEKDDKKAFQEVLELANMNVKKNADAKCELSFYYRDGIGVEKDEAEADKWLAAYKKDKPDVECKPLDFSKSFN